MVVFDPKFPYGAQMIADNFNPVFTFSSDLAMRAYQFGCDCYKTNKDKYAARGQNNPSNIIDQIRTGKMVEEMNYEQFNEYYSNLSKPDWNIYPAGQKNWDADLTDLTTTPITKLGAKSQRVSVGSELGISWIFEFRAGKKYDVDRGVFGDEAKKPGHFMLFSSIDVPNKRGELHAVIAVSTLHDLKLFEQTAIEKLRDNKVAVYLKTLQAKVK
jgi:hypothetical protein